MIKNNKGFSLAVLVISIAVIIIITSTAVITIKNINKDRGISEFMTDLADVKQYIIEYVNRDGTLPTKSEFDDLGIEIDAEKKLLQTLEEGNALGQIDENDVGAYYFVDIAKLGKIHLSDSERGYIFNEGTLNVYVLKPYEYKDVKYYALTSDLTGKSISTYRNVPFEVSITGNPVTWANSAEILVSVTNAPIGNGEGWNFRWLKGSHTVDDFKLASEVNYFTYGQAITLTENDVYTINVEDPDGNAVARKIVVTKIDDIPPTVVRRDGKIYIDDAETGVRGIRYKIKESNNFEISSEARIKNPEVYTREDEDDSDTQEQLLNKYLWGDKKIKGERIENYLAEYSTYYDKLKEYNETKLSPESTSPIIENIENAIKVLNKNYPQYAYNNRSFPNTERNIVLYVEDSAGNATVFSAVSRTELTNFQYITNDKETLTDTRVIINNNNEFTNNRTVSLYMEALHAKYFFASEEEHPEGTYKYFTNNKEEYTITSAGDGEKTIYVIFEDESEDTKTVRDSIYLDETKPTKNAPTVSGNIIKISVTCNQTDAESGLNGIVKYGIKEQSQSQYKWYYSPNDFPALEVGKSYHIATEVTDKAGNSAVSDPTPFVSSNATIVAKNTTSFWQDTYRTRISNIMFKKGSTNVPSGAVDLGNLSTDNTTSEIRAYVEDDGASGYKLTVISPQTIYANANLGAFFKDFTNLRTIDFSNFNTSQVTNMNQMFMGCTSLQSIDLDGFDTSNLQTMSEMFKNCSNIDSIDLSSFNTSQVTSLASVFSGCSRLSDISIVNFNTTRVTNMEYLFNQCSALTNVSVSGFNTSIVTTMTGMFAGCSQLRSLDISNFNTAQLVYADSMFANCAELKTIYASEAFVTTRISSSTDMFKNDTKIVGGNGTAYDDSKVNASMAHIDVSGNPGYFTLRWHFN